MNPLFVGGDEAIGVTAAAPIHNQIAESLVIWSLIDLCAVKGVMAGVPIQGA
jgi:hypothetical protein